MSHFDALSRRRFWFHVQACWRYGRLVLREILFHWTSRAGDEEFAVDPVYKNGRIAHEHFVMVAGLDECMALIKEDPAVGFGDRMFPHQSGPAIGAYFDPCRGDFFCLFVGHR